MVGPISRAAASYSTTQSQETRSLAADKIIKAVDSDQDGKITEEELSKAMEAQAGKQGPSAAELFKQLDQGGKGYITKRDIEDGLAKADQAQQARARKGGGEGGAPRAGGGASAAKAYDPADLNQDGVVTMRERMEYAQQAYAAQATKTGGRAAVYG